MAERAVRAPTWNRTTGLGLVEAAFSRSGLRPGSWSVGESNPAGVASKATLCTSTYPSRAATRDRTGDPALTRRALYRLSYDGVRAGGGSRTRGGCLCRRLFAPNQALIFSVRTDVPRRLPLPQCPAEELRRPML
jgi:hypothetical protein